MMDAWVSTQLAVESFAEKILSTENEVDSVA